MRFTMRTSSKADLRFVAETRKKPRVVSAAQEVRRVPRNLMIMDRT